jgi:hypothetical protein
MNTTAQCQPDEADERTRRHMRLCAELADLGMDLARAVAAIARADLAEPAEPPTPAEPAQEPPEPEVAPTTRPAPAARTPRAAGLSVRAASCKSGDPALIFTRLAACVRASIALEASLAAGLTPTSHAMSRARRADPRRAPLRDIFRRITEDHPDRADLVRETTARIDADLEADPDRALDLSQLFFTICEDFGIEVDLAKCPDPFLGLAPDPAAPDEAPTNPPDHRATSPPWR